MDNKITNLFCILLIATFIFSATPSPAAEYNSKKQPTNFLLKDLDRGTYLRPTLVGLGTIAGTYFISQLEDGATVFGILYGMTTFYLMNERISDDTEWKNLTVPISLLTLSVVNLALLSGDDDYKKSDVFTWNIVGLGLLSSYLIWDHLQTPYGAFQPWVEPGKNGLLWSLKY